MDSTMVAHELLLLEARDAPEEPENVQALARFSSLAASVGAGAGVGAGAARASSATSARRIEEKGKRITKECESSKAKPKSRGNAERNR